MFNRSAIGRDNEEEFRVKTAKDRASTTATVWLGLTFGCAECHTHKYDPLPQRDYYRFYAFFNNLVDTEIPAPPLARRASPRLRASGAGVRGEQAQAKARLKAYENDELPAQQAAWERSVDRRDLPPEIAAVLAVAPDRRTRRAGQAGRRVLPLDRPRVRCGSRRPCSTRR